ncbi:MAG: VCBS repeat-containing protein [Phycisphaerales bacterium]
MLAQLAICVLPALAPCVPELGGEQTYPSGVNDQRIVLADLDVDGDLDAVVGLFTTNGVNVMYADGMGGFNSPITIPAGAGGGVAVGDLNHDGRPDIVTANGLNDDISVILADTDFFGEQVRYPAGDGPSSIAIVDLNMDTHPDLAVSAGLDDTLRIFLGDGTGAFAAQPPITIDDLRQVLAADFNADGIPDLVCPRSSPSKVDVLLGVGDGTFETPVSYDAGFGANFIALGDLDENGTMDIVVVHGVVSVPPTDATLSVLLGGGDGTFAPPVSYTVGQRPHSCAIADLNGDGHLDVVESNIDTSELSVLYGVGDGTLQPQVRMPFAGQPTSVALGDLVGDGFPDLVFLNNASGDVSVVLNACDAGGCNEADLAEPFGTLDFSDVIAFLTAFGTMGAPADLAEPFGTWDFSDVIAFLGAFGVGCP